MTDPGNQPVQLRGDDQASIEPPLHSLLLLYAVTIFLGAFLLFQVQPLISKAILPWFGGSAGVWTTCMLFFQVLLFLGYAYAHVTTSRLSPRMQGIVHASLLVVAAGLFRIRPSPDWKPDGDADPILSILLLLTAHVGLPFFLLSATSPLIQVWWNRALGSGTPYRLYALSNAGSLLALLSYPFLVEQRMVLSAQTTMWSVAFVLQAVLLIASGRIYWWRADGVTATPAEQQPSNPKPRTQARKAKDATFFSRLRAIASAAIDPLLWIVLAAAGSTMLLSTTANISHDVAVVPLLWILPLSLYLLTFILCFSGWSVPRWPFILLMLGVTGYLAFEMSGANVWIEEKWGYEIPRVTGLADSFIAALIMYLLAMFACCMVCHGELWRLKPPANQLTAFYLYVAFGGALGGVGCGVLAPLLLPTYYEFSIGMVLCWLLLIISLLVSRSVMKSYLSRFSFLALILGFAVFSITLLHHALNPDEGRIDRSRNFYGALEVKYWVEDVENEEDDYVTLVNGLITHGAQFTHESLRLVPTTYYATDSGGGIVMKHTDMRERRRVGAVGLGVGTMAAYGMPGDYFRFYDINPGVVKFAKKHFYYLDDTAAEYEIAMGDARNSLESELAEGQQQEFDVLILDAFSSDAIPLHLLTTEAFEIYLPHLRDDNHRQGIIAIHISNRYLELLPVAQALAAHFDLDVAQIESGVDDERLAYAATWVLLSRPGGLDVILAAEESVLPVERLSARPAYTDDTINLPSLLKVEKAAE